MSLVIFIAMSISQLLSSFKLRLATRKHHLKFKFVDLIKITFWINFEGCCRCFTELTVSSFTILCHLHVAFSLKMPVTIRKLFCKKIHGKLNISREFLENDIKHFTKLSYPVNNLKCIKYVNGNAV